MFTIKHSIYVGYNFTAITSNDPNYHLQDGDEGAVNYVALNFASRSAKRWKNTSELPQECLYSGTRHPQ